MLLTLLGISTTDRLLQELKALLPILVTPSPNVRFTRFVQLAKAELPILPDRMLADCRAVHSWNTPPPIVSNPLPIVTVLRPVQRKNT
jgi:hypothetical protein